MEVIDKEDRFYSNKAFQSELNSATPPPHSNQAMQESLELSLICASVSLSSQNDDLDVKIDQAKCKVLSFKTPSNDEKDKDEEENEDDEETAEEIKAEDFMQKVGNFIIKGRKDLSSIFKKVFYI